MVTGARRVCEVKAEASDSARRKRQIDATWPAEGRGQEDEWFCAGDAPSRPIQMIVTQPALGDLRSGDGAEPLIQPQG